MEHLKIELVFSSPVHIVLKVSYFESYFDRPVDHRLSAVVPRLLTFDFSS